MNGCTISIDISKAKALKSLKSYCGDNTTQYIDYISQIIKEQAADGTLVPTDKFATWYKNNFGRKPNFSTKDGNKLRDRIIRFYNETSSTVESSARNTAIQELLATYGYSSAGARTLGKRLVANRVLDFYRQLNYILRANPAVYNTIQEQIKKVGAKTFYFSQVSKRFTDILVDRIVARTGESKEAVRQHINDEKRSYVERALGGENISLQDSNLVALVYEFNENPKAFVEEVCLDGRLGKLRLSKSDEFKDDEELKAIDAQSDLGEENNPENAIPTDDDFNSTIAMYDHSGTYTTAMTHVDESIRAYFDSLQKLNSGETVNNNPDYDTNNEFGIPDTMNADECCTILYHYGDYSNVDRMIASIQAIADSIPGFAAFNTFAQDLRNNRNFAFEVYRTFGKIVISKIVAGVGGSSVRSRISNQRSNRYDALRFEYLNSIKTTSITNDIGFNTEELETLVNLVKNEQVRKNILSDRNNEWRKDVISKLHILLHRYYPTITAYTVENYVNLHMQEDGTVQVDKNIGSLIDIIRKTIKETKETQANYRSRQVEIGKAWRHNQSLKEQSAQGEEHQPEEYINLNPLFAQSYVSPTQAEVANDLAEMLSPYSLVAVELNSSNVKGNQSSDVINSSFITNFLNTIKNDIALGNYGSYKFQSRQYDFSNILIERVENGVIVNKGLFRYDTSGDLVPTDYAKSLLSVHLFDGAINDDTATSALYSAMSMGDYVGTAYINFFSGKENDVASYFMRIPSDAPKNFIVRAPRYSCNKLFSLANKSEVESIIKERFNILSQKVIENDPATISANKKPISINRIDKIIGHLLADDGTIVVKIPDYILSKAKYTEGQELTLQFRYKGESTSDVQNIYVLKGIYKNGKLMEASLIGTYNDELSSDVIDAFRKHIIKQLDKQGVTKYKINRDHVIFKQFRNVFTQELLDAAVAIDKFFVTSEDGLVQRYTEAEAETYGVEAGSIKWKEGISKDGTKVAGAYEHYHHKNGVIVETKDGVDYLVGNVFHSDRFTIYDTQEGKPRNYGEEVLKEVFSLLYGGSKDTYLHVEKDATGKIIGVRPTKVQQETIDNKLEEFINDYISDSFKQLENLDKSLKGTELTRDTAAEFVLNYHLMYVNFNDLFEGDTKFYKDAQTFLKRAKEVQGSGVPYGIVDYISPVGGTHSIVESRLNSTVFEGGYTVKQYNSFRAVTVVNTITSNTKAVEILRDKLIKDCKLSEDEADTLLKGYRDNTTVNDAQSYITFDEWIRRVSARGQLLKYKPLIDKILSGAELNGDELSEFVQVQKNFYYDQYYDEHSGILAPRQIKNAEFVLIPQLIKGTELEKVAELMKKYNIDQLNTEETSKAGKTDVLEVFDGKTGKVKEDILKELEEGSTSVSEFGHRVAEASQLYSYNYLYTQQETPQHLNATNKAGIQIVKKILDNITPESSLWSVKQKFFALYSANIRESFSDLMKELNLELDENGNLVLEENELGEKTIKSLNFEIFYQRLKEEVARLGLDSNMMDYVTLDDTQMEKDGGVTIMPNYMSNVLQKLESIAQSVFNNRITRQTLPGFHAAQITNIGFIPLATSKEQVSYSKDLKYHMDDKGRYADYVEIMLPASAFGFKRTYDDGTLKPKGRIEDDGKPTPGSLLEELYNAELQDVIGYRIPTEGKQSICKMRVVGFIDDSLGSTIVVPNDWVTQTGSDFDIDSVYGIQFDTYVDSTGRIQKTIYSHVSTKRYEQYVRNNMTEEERKEAEKNKDFNYNNWAIMHDLLSRDEWSKENIDAVAEDNSRAARNNEILQCMLDILGSDEALEENLSRSNFDDIIAARDAIYRHGIIAKVAAQRKARSPYNFMDQAAFQEDVMSGARLKAFSVTRDTFCSICNTVRPTIANRYQITVAYSPSVISYEKAVERFGQRDKTGKLILDKTGKSVNIKEKDGKIYITHDKLGWSADNKNVVGKILTAYSSQTTAHILDAVKEGFIPNVNDMTFAVYKLFPDLGIDYDTAIAFMMQNGVTRIVNAYNSSKSIYQTDYSSPINSAIENIAEELGYDVSEYKTIESLVAQLAKDYNEDFKKIFGSEATISLNVEDIKNLVVDGEVLHNELYNPRKGKEKSLFDLGVVLQYSRFNDFAQGIGNLTRVCNPDKFGAKQTIFATNEVFDTINDLLQNSENMPLTVDGKSLLQAIYPGIQKGLDSFITSPREESAYPPLYNFLKYATASSIKINRSLFITQSFGFRRAVYRLQDFFSDNKKLTEKQYKDFEKYIISYLYSQCQSIMRPLTFYVGGEQNAGNVGFVGIVNSNETSLDQDAIFAEERRRIFGYGVEPDVKFEVADINEPTQEEVNAFAKLTPAQKVVWIKANFTDAGIFEHIRTTLFNERTTRGNKAGSQTIEFVDTSLNIENVYSAFEKAFCNTNPLVALTAYDVVKYAFVVEGFKMKRNAVNKMIPNSVLYNDFGIFGTGLVAEMQGKVANISTTFGNQLDTLCESYIRSHIVQQIPTVTVRQIPGKGYELPRRVTGIIQIAKTDAGNEIAKKFRIVYDGGKQGLISNSYVKLRFGKQETIYKIIDNPNYSSYYLYPINKLEENEHELDSANSSNNIYAHPDYYETIIDEYESQYSDFDIERFKEVANKYNINEFKAAKPEKVEASQYATDFDLDNPEDDIVGAVDYLKKEVQSHFGDNESDEVLFHINSGLSKRIKKEGAKYGLAKTFLLNPDTKDARLITLNIYRLSPSVIKKSIQPYLGPNNEHNEIKPKDKRYTPLIKKLRSLGIVAPTYKDLYVIEPSKTVIENTDETEDDGIRRSSITESSSTTDAIVKFASSAYKGINRRIRSVEDIEAGKARRRLRDRGITSDSTSVANHIDEVIKTTAEYVSVTTEKTINSLKYFAQNPNGDGYMSVTDEAVIELIKADTELRRKYIKTLLDAEAIVRNFSLINELDIKSQDPEIQRYLNTIKSCINDLQNNSIILRGKELFANKYLASLSNDPLIQQDILNILDGYNSTNTITAWIGDLQETTNPLIQIISKKVIADIHAKEMEAVRRVREFRKFIKDIKAKAAAEGKSIDWSHIIDDDGRFIQEFKQQLVEDMDELRDAISSAKANYGEGSIEHLEARLAYDKWKLEHIEQQLDDDYYRRRIALDEEMLHGSKNNDTADMPFGNQETPGHPIVFSEYKKLEARRREILSHIVNGVLEESLQQELDKVRRQIDDLTTPVYHDQTTGELVAREEYDPLLNPLTGTEEEKRRKILYSGASQRALVKYLNAVRELNQEYFEYDVEFGFQEELERNLHIVDSFENRNPNGDITVPLNILMENEEYVRAKEWIQHNARFVITPQEEDSESLIDRLNAAFKTLHKENSRAVLRTIAKNKDAYDHRGTIDGNKFTEAEIDKIRKEQEADYDFHEDAPFSDKGLISNGSPTGVIYTRDFYKHMTSNGISNPEWIAKVHEINELLAPYYDNATKKIRFELIPNTEEGRAIYDKLETLYEALADIKKTVDSSNGAAIRRFIEANVDFEIDEAEYKKQEAIAKTKGEVYLRAWRKANLEIVDGEAKPNHFIYGYAKPKDKVKDKYTDKARTEALQLIHRTYTSTPTEYYYKKAEEMKQKGQEAFEEWYKKNHIFNPYTHSYEPIRCWMTMSFRPGVSTEGKWEPAFNQTYKVPRESKINPKFKPEIGNALNYKKGSGYDNPLSEQANNYEIDLKKEIQRLLSMLATTQDAQRFINRGYLPARMKEREHDAAYWGKELLKSFGWIEGEEGRQHLKREIDYYKDCTIPMPMLSLLKQKELESLHIEKPIQKENESDEDFAKRLTEYNEQVNKLKEDNKKAHREALDKNWESVIEDFIVKASHFNAIQDNKYMLFYGRSMLEKLGTYKRQYGFFGDFIAQDDSTTDYLKTPDRNLLGQYENWVRRLVYNQWKEPNRRFTKWASRIQSLTSAQYMMMNIRGGIANITLGETQILAEAFAREYFGCKHWAQGKAYWISGIPSYFAHLYDDKSSSIADAIIKFMNVVEFDELTGRCRIVEDPASKTLNRLRNAMYSPETIGENFMQNGAMFSMMLSHRLYEVVDDNTGERTVLFKNEAEAIRDAHIDAMRQVLEDDLLEKFNTFINDVKKDANKLKEYVWRRRDFVTEFAEQYLTDEQRNKFIEERTKLEEAIKAEFNNDELHPTLLSQFALGDDQQLAFKEGSIMSKYDIATTDGTPTKAYQLLADFRGRVIAVNKKIHGVYDRLGQAQLEKTWYGSLVMQYHKHIYPGILKRWRREGSFNEQRGTIEKGSYVALKDFLAIPFRKYNDRIKKAKNVDHLTDAELEGMIGIQNILKEVTDFALNVKLHWNLLPEHERANIRRNLGDLLGVMSALFLAIGLRALADDDDEDGILYNLALYEADRLASESFQFNPLGMISEGKKLWSSPIAAQSGIEDLIQSAGILSQMLIEGDEFDPYYHSGRFAGEHKLSVYIQRRIPVWRGIKTGFIDIVESNSYYKMGDNMLSIIPVNKIADWTKSKFD